MFHKNTVLAMVLIVIAAITAGCVSQTATAVRTGDSTESEHEEVQFDPTTATLDEVISFVEQEFPPELYMTNDLIPNEDDWQKLECEGYDEISVVTGWVFNDEHTHLYVPDALGFFEDVCLNVDLQEGGPEIDELAIVASGNVEIGSLAAGGSIPKLLASNTPAEVVAIGAGLQISPYGLLCLDPDTPQTQSSDLELEPSWFKDKTLGVQNDGRYIIEDFFVERFDEIDREDITIESAGFLPTPLIEGKWDCYSAFETNQPRFLEADGYNNWVFFNFARKAGYNNFANVQVVSRELLDRDPDMLRRYLAAVRHGIQYILDNPEGAAEIAVQYAHEAGHTEVTLEQALRRFELERPLIMGSGENPILYMPKDVWNEFTAILYKYDENVDISR